MTDWKVEKKLDIAQIVSVLLVISAVVGWGLSVEVRLAKGESYRDLIAMQLKQAEKERDDNREFIEKLVEKLK